MKSLKVSGISQFIEHNLTSLYIYIQLYWVAFYIYRFTYSSVQYTAFHAKKFTALVSSPTNGTSHPEHVDFELQSRALAQALYRTITEFHTFFKREAVGRVVKTAGFCKSLLGNFKGQNPDRFYFDVTRTHREVVDHVWSILHPTTRNLQNDDFNNSQTHNNSSSSPPGLMLPSGRGSSRPPSSSSIRNNSRHQSHSHSNHDRGSSSSLHSSLSSSQTTPPPPAPRSPSTTADGNGSHSHHHHQRLLPPLSHAQGSTGGSNSMHRSHSVQDSDLRPPNFTYLPPLPPYSQRSCSSDALLRTSINGSRRQHLRTIPTHGPHMASMASFNPYLSPSISETGSDGEEEDLYIGGGSECYVTMSSCSDNIYMPSTCSDPGTSGTLDRRMYRSNLMEPGSTTLPSTSDISGPMSDLYIMSGDSEGSGASYRVSSPPPLYREFDEEHTVPINFDTTTDNSMTRDEEDEPTSPRCMDSPNSASITLVSPIIPMSGSESNFDAAAVLTRTRELEGELQRLRTAMTCRLCKQNPIGATFCPCGHTVCCFQCAQRMGTCWECDMAITSVQRMVLTR